MPHLHLVKADPPESSARIIDMAEWLQRDPPPTRFERLCARLGRFDVRYFFGLLFPLAAAAFCVGYFGLRELPHRASNALMEE